MNKTKIRRRVNKRVDLRVLKRHWSSFVRMAELGETIEVEKDGTDYVQLVPYAPIKPTPAERREVRERWLKITGTLKAGTRRVRGRAAGKKK